MNAKGSVKRVRTRKGQVVFLALSVRNRDLGVYDSYGLARLVASGVMTPKEARHAK